MKNRIYIILQLAGWGSYFVLNVGFSSMLKGFNPAYLALSGNIVISGFFLTHLYRSRYGEIEAPAHAGEIAKKVLLSATVMSLLWSLWSLPSNYLLLQTFDLLDESFSVGYFFAIWANLFILMLLWLALYTGVKVLRSLQQSQVEKWQLQAAIKDAELIALKSQINPHFIFNCLNNIRSLVVEDPTRSREMITHLSDLLRYSFKFTDAKHVSIEHELEVVKDYLALESIQFEDRLKYNINVADDLMDFNIPPMTIQLLVENAIKHGISDLQHGGEIDISAFEKGGKVIIRVDNSGTLITRESSGIGLQNAKDRMNLMYNHVRFHLRPLERDKVRAQFELA